jgi:hypothetical protein
MKFLNIILLMLIFFSYSLYAQKPKEKKKSPMEEMTEQVEKMKKSLADARRELQKCVELKNVSDSLLNDSLSTEIKRSYRLEKKNSDYENKFNKLNDSLKSVEAKYNALKESLLLIENQKSEADKSAKLLISELNDSLKLYKGSQMNIYQSNESVFVSVSDSVLLGGFLMVTLQGRSILDEISQVYRSKYQSTKKLIIHTYADDSTIPGDFWRNSNLKALAVANVIDFFKMPRDKVIFNSNGLWTGEKKAKKAPVLIEFIHVKK